MRLTSDRPNYPDSGSQTGRAGPRTWSFHERYASDAEFKRQIDDARQRNTTAALTTSLNMVNKGQKLY